MEVHEAASNINGCSLGADIFDVPDIFDIRIWKYPEKAYLKGRWSHDERGGEDK